MSEHMMYERVTLTGTFTTQSEAHFGASFLFSETAFNQGEPLADQTSSVQPCCKDNHKNPYVPSATIRGWLRDTLMQQPDEQGDLELALVRMFGESRADDEGRAGLLRVSDAVIPEGKHQTTDIVRRTQVDPLLGVAEEHKLFAVEVVPAHTEFVWQCELDIVHHHEVEILLGLLACFDGSSQSSLGRGGSQYWGCLQWRLETINIVTHSALNAWLASDNEPLPEDSSGNSHAELIARSFVPKKRYSLPLCLRLITPMLINQQAEKKMGCPPEQSRQAKSKSKHEQPDHVFTQNSDGHLVVPASSQKGLLRAHSRKILLTLISDGELPTQAQIDHVEHLLTCLYGGSGQKSAVWIKAAVSEQTATVHQKMFNAIDRFTGGVADGRLFSARAGWAKQLFGEISVDAKWWQQPEQRWCHGLALLLLRDAMEGDLRLGWGKNKGFGTFALAMLDTALYAQDSDTLPSETESGASTLLTEWSEMLVVLQQQFGSQYIDTVLQALEDKLVVPTNDKEVS